MSKILLHSNAPWAPSGYGVQTKHLIKIFKALGHRVAVSAFYGLNGGPLEIDDVLYLPNGQLEFGIDVFPGHMEHIQPDLTLMLMDLWKMGPLVDLLKEHNVASWVPVDCAPLGKVDREVLRLSGIRPIAMSKFGEDQLKEHFPRTLYAPHMVDRAFYQPLDSETRDQYREAMGLKDRFAVGICAANNDQIRKGFPEQFEAFRRFHKKHPEAFLMIHSLGRSTRGLNLEMLAYDMGLPMDSIRITDQYVQIAGLFDESLMADWFGVLDLLSACSYGEGFGVPMLEAQACGTPVVSTNASAMREVRGHGFGVTGEPFWNHVHGAWWTRPNVDSIVRAYEKAFVQASTRRKAADEFAEKYTVEYVAENHWKPILEELLP